jgi:hypothetical protein
MTLNNFFRGLWAVLLCVTVAGHAVAAEDAAKKDEPPKQSGNMLIKFRANANDAKIQEVAEFYGAKTVSELSGSEADSHKDPDLWRKLRFEEVNDLKDIARRIFMDSRVDEVENKN